MVNMWIVCVMGRDFMRKRWSPREKEKKLEKNSKKLYQKALTRWIRSDIITGLSTRRRHRSSEASGPEKKFKKLLKNLLTNGSGCDIINKSPTERRRSQKKRAWERMRYNLKPLQRANEKSLKTFEKPLDKGKRMWYNKQAADESGGEQKRSLIENWTTMY